MSFINKLDRYFDKNYKKIVGYGLIGAGFLIVLYYILACGKTELHADCMDTLMWANASYDSGSVFNRNFEYACLLPFGGQLLMQPFIAIFGLSYKAHIIGMVLFLILFIFSLIYMLRGMNLSHLKIGGMVFAVLMMTCSSAKLREIFWGHIIYYSLGLMFLFIGCGIALRLIKKSEFKFNFLYAALLIWTMLCATDGIQALTIYILPVCAGLIGYTMLDFNNELKCRKNLIMFLCALIIISGTVLGTVILKIISFGITQSYADAYSKFNDSNTWFNNLSTWFSCHYTLLGVDINNICL